ncbi:Cif family virulence factor [Spirosoma arcticum]
MKTSFLVLILTFASVTVTTFAQSSADETAIKKVIEAQTTAGYARDEKAYLSHLANTPYISRVGIYPGNEVTKLVGDDFRKAITETIAKPGEPIKDKVTRENWLIRVNGNSAFVVFDQHNARPDGTTRHSVEERYLERMNNEWKLVNVTVLVGTENGQNKLEEDAIKKVLETETRAYHEANGDLLQAQWTNKPYAERQQANFQEPLGTPFLKGDKLRAFSNSYFKTLKPSGHTVRMSDYDVHISGATAWATYTQEEVDGTGTVVGKQREIRVLEREPVGWKIVFLGFQAMK